MKNTFPYTSLHNYLDTALCHIDNPSQEQIKQAKRAYRKAYYTHYRRQRRKLRKEYTLGFTADYLKEIKNAKGSLSISQFLYKAVDQAIGKIPIQPHDPSVLGSINRQLMHLIDIVEEALDSGSNALNENVLEKIEILREQFSQTFSPKEQ